MEKLIALYKTPQDPEAFLEHYRAVHVPLVKQLPGLLSVEITLIKRTLLGEEGNFLLAEMAFADPESFKAALKSQENAAVGADAMAFAGSLITVMTGTSVEF
ncbi:MAG TPA: EthD family reductase [Sphingobium sp.]|nr:EthD family reductase [Sphingobium sp.]